MNIKPGDIVYHKLDNTTKILILGPSTFEGGPIKGHWRGTYQDKNGMFHDVVIEEIEIVKGL